MADEKQMTQFIRQNETAHPNAKKPLHEIQTSDLVYLDDHPCKMFDPPVISPLMSISVDGLVTEKDESLLVVHGVSVIDGEEYGQMYSAGEDVQYFVDDHDEREWLVVCLSPLQDDTKSWIG